MTLDFGNFNLTNSSTGGSDNNKLNVDLSNLPTSSKEEITNYSYPNLDNAPDEIETLANGSNYTATNTGWVVIKCLSTAIGQYAGLYKGGVVFAGGFSSSSGGYDMYSMPVTKGEKFMIAYNGYPTANITTYFWKANGYQ